MLVAYNVIIRLAKDSKAAYTLFLLSAGVGWVLYMFFFVFSHDYAPLVGYALTKEFDELGGGAHALSHLTRAYWMFPEITGLLSLLFLMERKRLPAALLFGLTVLIYPTFAIGFALILFAYSVASRGLFSGIVSSVPLFAAGALFAAPWIVTSLQNPGYFSDYKHWYNGDPFVQLLITYGITFPLALHAFARNRTLLKDKRFLLPLLALLSLSSLAHVYEIAPGNTLLQDWFSRGLQPAGSLLHENILFIDLPLLALLAWLFVDTLKLQDAGYKFIWLWIIGIVAMTIVTPKLAFWWPARLRWLMLLPLAIAASYGIQGISARRIPGVLVTRKRLLAAIILFSLPALLMFNIRMHQVVLDDGSAYISEEDYRAMQFLSRQERGRVLSLYQVGNIMPYYTGHYALLFNSGRSERLNDTEAFYSGRQGAEMLQKYGIDYVFLGENERKLGALDRPYLRKIYGDGTEVYEVL
jgi:hypothetical protein